MRDRQVHGDLVRQRTEVIEGGPAWVPAAESRCGWRGAGNQVILRPPCLRYFQPHPSSKLRDLYVRHNRCDLPRLRRT